MTTKMRDKLYLLNPGNLSNKQLAVTTVSVFCVGQITNYTFLRTPVQWVFFILLIVWIYRFFQTKVGKRIGNGMIFAAFMQNFRGRR